MKKLLLGLTLLASVSAYSTIEDGKYLLNDIYCSGQAIEAAQKTAILERMKLDVTVMNINGNEVVVSSVDECGSSRSEYSVNDKENSTRMKYKGEQISKFENACLDTQRMKDSSDMLVENVTTSKVEILFSDLKVDNSICGEKLIFVFEK